MKSCDIYVFRKNGLLIMNDLEKSRKNLDMCDEILIDVLRMRFQIIQDITAYKKANHINIVQLQEEKRKDEFIRAKLEDYADSESVMKVYDAILREGKHIESRELFDFNIFLIGFMGVGKSTVSKALQRIFAMDVIEMDELIAQKNGMSISEIFELHGEEYFRQEETNLLKNSQKRKNVVISCGGGVAMRQVNVDEMRKSGKIVLLTATPETILGRVESSHDRPLLENNKTVEHIAELMAQRESAYQAAADITIPTDGRDVFDICEDIIQKVKEYKTK